MGHQPFHGKGRIARRLPMVAGIDLAGTVLRSRVAAWKPGDAVIVNGWGLSETEWGGYSRFQSVRAAHLTRRPEGFSAVEAMAIGTAGYTAALCVLALEDWGVIRPDGAGEVLVTGAAGGVGSVAVALLARRGYRVVAGTGRESQHGFLRDLGAADFMPRSALAEPGRMLQAASSPASMAGKAKPVRASTRIVAAAVRSTTGVTMPSALPFSACSA